MPPGHFGILKPVNQQAEKGVILLSGLTESDYQGEICLLLNNEGKEEYVWNARNSLEPLNTPLSYD